MQAGDPIDEVEMLAQTHAEMELAAVLAPTRADEAKPDIVATALAVAPLMVSATWLGAVTS